MNKKEIIQLLIELSREISDYRSWEIGGAIVVSQQMKDYGISPFAPEHNFVSRLTNAADILHNSILEKKASFNVDKNGHFTVYPIDKSKL